MITTLIVISICLLALGYVSRTIRDEIVKQQELRIHMLQGALENLAAQTHIYKNNLDNATASLNEHREMMGKMKKYCHLSCFVNAEKED